MPHRSGRRRRRRLRRSRRRRRRRSRSSERREAIRRGLVRATTSSERALATAGRKERAEARRGAVVRLSAGVGSTIIRKKGGGGRRSIAYIQTPTGQLVEIPEEQVAGYQKEVAKAKAYEKRFAEGTLGIGELSQHVGKARAKILMQERLRSKQRAVRELAERVTPKWMGRSVIKDFQK